MSLRRRLTIIAGGSVAVAVVLALLGCYAIVRNQLLSQVDDSLRAQQTTVDHTGYIQHAVPGIPASSGGPAPYTQVVLPNGQVISHQGNVTLTMSKADQRIAATGSGSSMTDVHVGDDHLRVLTFGSSLQGADQSVAVQLARPLNGVDSILRHLRLILALLAAGGIALAAVLGRFASRRVLRPLNEVRETARHIEETEDLTERLRVHADDEVGQLARRFNAMLDRLQRSRDALDDSVRAQRQLVADASHELRTPVTSLRTNIEVLLTGAELDPEDRERLLADVVEQSEELSALVNDLIELARGDEPVSDTDEIRLDRVAEESIARARRNAPGIAFEPELAPVIVDGTAERLSRAINNLLDNAARHSPPGGVVELRVSTDGVRVRDHGPGVSDEDLPYVFDRFYRGTNARGRQGSGLGLAIVRQVTEQHGGTASVANAPDGGAIFTLALPGAPASDRPGEDDAEGDITGSVSQPARIG